MNASPPFDSTDESRNPRLSHFLLCGHKYQAISYQTLGGLILKSDDCDYHDFSRIKICRMQWSFIREPADGMNHLNISSDAIRPISLPNSSIYQRYCSARISLLIDFYFCKSSCLCNFDRNSNRYNIKSQIISTYQPVITENTKNNKKSHSKQTKSHLRMWTITTNPIHSSSNRFHWSEIMFLYSFILLSELQVDVFLFVSSFSHSLKIHRFYNE